ncbi:SIMPL domain-containing protein [Maricaulis sp. CAU 1757]
MFRALLASTALMAGAASPGLAQEVSEPTLSLSASADVQLAPEYASVRSGVVSRAASARQAMADNTARMNRVFEALREAGIAAEDIQTSQLSVSPVYGDRRELGDSEHRIIAYEARNTVTAQIRDTGRVGQAIDAMVAAGANNIDGISFAADDTEAALDEARREAIAALLRKADFFAEAAGFELCGIRRMSESSHGGQPPVMYARAAMMESDDTSVAPGRLTLTANVSADFCITQ